eukprot:12413652-Karenia_brevis.AAC.1
MWAECQRASVPGAAELPLESQRTRIRQWEEQQGIKSKVRQRSGWWSARCSLHESCTFEWKHVFDEDHHWIYVKESGEHASQQRCIRGYTEAQ